MAKSIVFTTLAINQTEFFVGLGLELKKAGYQVAIVSFHEGSSPMLSASGLQFYNVFDVIRAQPQRSANLAAEVARWKSELQPENLEHFFSHETASFYEKRLSRLQQKFCEYAAALTEIFDQLKSQGFSQPIVIQETGGFLSLATTYFVAKSKGLTHYFIEPGFYRGRVMFVKNSFWAPKVKEQPNVPVTEHVRRYLAETVNKKQLVIPKKDAWQYTGVFGKILNFRNFKRLGSKLYQKYILKQREEFSHIRAYVERHTRMMANRILLNFKYQQTPTEPFVYFPLHVPMDMALTVRSPFFLDQFALLDYLSRSIPSGYKLAFKEHPALVGSLDRSRVKALLAERENVVMLHPSLNNFEVVKRASAVVTVNSKSGSESILLGKGVVVFGDAFYSETSLIYSAKDWYGFPKALEQALAHIPNQQRIEEFFQSAFDQSREGELYLCSQDNLQTFAQSIRQTIEA